MTGQRCHFDVERQLLHTWMTSDAEEPPTNNFGAAVYWFGYNLQHNGKRWCKIEHRETSQQSYQGCGPVDLRGSTLA